MVRVAPRLIVASGNFLSLEHNPSHCCCRLDALHNIRSGTGNR
jgi:hypothetical protein